MKYYKGLQKIGKDGRPRWALLASFDIPCGQSRTPIPPPSDRQPAGTLYLRRLRIIQTPYFFVYLHETRNPDEDYDLHDHPWVFWTWVLKGGYTEYFRPTKTAVQRLRRHERWSFMKMPLSGFHRIIKLYDTPTYTLVFGGRRVREWGFLLDDGTWQNWKEYKIVNFGGEVT